MCLRRLTVPLFPGRQVSINQEQAPRLLSEWFKYILVLMAEGSLVTNCTGLHYIIFIKMSVCRLQTGFVSGLQLLYYWMNPFDILYYDNIGRKGVSCFGIFEKSQKLYFWRIFTQSNFGYMGGYHCVRSVVLLLLHESF